MRNPDGHVSEIRASLPISLVLPPYTSSVGTTPHLEDSTINLLLYLDNDDILPSYQSRIYDRLWDGISYIDLDTSALNTPTTMSRRTSTDNFRDLNQPAMPNFGDLEAGLHRAMRERHGDEESNHECSSDSLYVLASTSRLTTPAHSTPTLQVQTTNVFDEITPLNGDDEPVRLSPISSPEMQHISPTISSNSSHYASEDYIDLGQLSRVPSYTTANSAVLNLDPITVAPPTYASATTIIPDQSPSRPGSAGASRHSPSCGLERAATQPNYSPAPLLVSSGDLAGGFSNVGHIGIVYDAPQTFKGLLKRLSVMSIFSDS